VTVKQLIERLREMPEDAPVLHVWDGVARTEVEHVWLAASGEVVTADNNQVVYDTRDRPADAPTSEQNRYWYTPGSSS
jgi:hypothetical protein